MILKKSIRFNDRTWTIRRSFKIKIVRIFSDLAFFQDLRFKSGCEMYYTSLHVSRDFSKSHLSALYINIKYTFFQKLYIY